jgi:hypothetical protein
MSAKEVFKNLLYDISKLKYIVKNGTICNITGSYVFNVQMIIHYAFY